MIRIITILTVLTSLALVASTGAARARHHHHRATAPPPEACGDVMRPCWGLATAPPAPTRQRVPQGRQAAIVGHPAGCPTRAFCGCGASVRVFGHPVRGLYLAANWLRFPRAAPAPGMVAARRGHVFVLEQQLDSNGTWMVYDANSGGHATRVHARSIAGYVIVNPRA